jgi:hypothetical protein
MVKYVFQFAFNRQALLRQSLINALFMGMGQRASAPEGIRSPNRDRETSAKSYY